jgi:hypothetical protein
VSITRAAPYMTSTHLNIGKGLEAVHTRPAPRTYPREGVNIGKAVFTLARANEVFTVSQAVVEN